MMTEEWKSSVGERLLQIRNEKRMTQEELAEYLNVSRQSVSKWELNKTMPDVEKLMQLSELYDVTLDYLVKGVEEKEEPLNDVSNETQLQVSETSMLNETEAGFTNPSALELTVYKIVFLVSMIVSGVVFICSLFFSIGLMRNHTFSAEGKEHGVLYVDQVYEQYTLADVQMVDDVGKFINKKVWLDVNGVREGDYIGYYYEEETSKIHFMYYAKSLLLPFVVVILSLIFTIICWMAFRSHGGGKKRKKEGK